MGSGCSSPLRKFGKRGKGSRRDSSIFGDQDESGDNDRNPQTRASAQKLHQKKLDQQQQQQQKKKYLLDNEITIQSEYDPDQPSTGSNTYTDTKNVHPDESNLSAISKPNPSDDTNKGSDGGTLTTNSPGGPGATMLARIRGLTGNYDRHLLVSPALSPAPSTCYSPTPNLAQLDLSELNEAFRCLTFGPILDDIEQNLKQFQKTTTNQLQTKPPASAATTTTQLSSYNTQHLIQNQSDLTNYISVILIANDTTTCSSSMQQQTGETNLSDFNLTNESLILDLEASLRCLCDEHTFSLRFLNLSQTFMNENFHINNVLDVSMQIIENEYQQNGQRSVVILLNGIEHTNNNSNSNKQQHQSASTTPGDNVVIDKRTLPLQIEAQTMNKLIALIGNLDQTDTSERDKSVELFRRWYNQVGNIHYLRPIYLVDSRILSNVKIEHELAWQKWLEESQLMIQTLEQLLASPDGSDLEIKMKSLYTSLVDFVSREPNLQKRTLLVKNMMMQQQQQQQQQQSYSNDIGRLLSDSNKLVLKRLLNYEELSKTIIDWVSDNFGKFLENIMEIQLLHGKQVPQFIERNLFTELTCQRQKLESYLSNLSESFEAKCDTFYSNQISPILSRVISNSALSTATKPTTTMASESDANLTDMDTNAKFGVSTNQLVFISGPKGCGKSSLMSKLIKLIGQEYSSKVHILYRFCNISIDSSSPNRLLRSICEQFCQIQGENIAAASYIYSARLNIMKALNKIVKYQPTFLLIDGLDQLKQVNPSTSPLANNEWLCEWSEPNNMNLKVILTLESNSKFYREAMRNFTDATFISLDNPSISEWAQMLNLNAKSRRLRSSGNIYDDIKNIGQRHGSQQSASSNNSGSAASCNQLTYRDVSDVINMCMIRKSNNEFVYPELNFRQSQDLNSVKFEQMRQSVLNHLHYLVSPYQLCSLLILFDLSRNGLFETDLVNMMSMISQFNNKEQQQQANQAARLVRFSLTHFELLRNQLKPWLLSTVCDRRIKILANRDFVKRSINEYYVPSKFPNLITTTREIMLEYYARPTRSAECTSTNIKDMASLLASEPELLSVQARGGSLSGLKGLRLRAWLACQASELSYLLVNSNVPLKACDYLTNKTQFFNQLQNGTNPEDFIEDCEQLRLQAMGRKTSSMDELQVLVSYVRQSVYALRYDGSQIFSQIYCRANDNISQSKSGAKVPKSKSGRINSILNMCSSPPVPSLLPVSETSVKAFTETRIGISDSGSTAGGPKSGGPASSATGGLGGQGLSAPGGPPQQGSNNNNSKQRIFTIKDNSHQVIVLYPDKGSLAIWDILEERPVRTIEKLDCPRDLRMIDKRRAIILCNRELRVYDLDSAQLVTKLKGLMNQKMPWFEVFGTDFIVAISRNRMYVNLLNLNTGELETTFKVGEDRFLNSLLVSRNGGICVCGDETQKPFPLLVWNLNDRRLMYDLRIDKHEFVTRMSAISDDGHFVVCVCRQLQSAATPARNQPVMVESSTSSSGSSPAAPTDQPGNSAGATVAANFIVIYDLSSGTMFKKWKPGIDTCAVAISYSANKSGKLVSSLADSTILVWDLISGSKRHTLVGHSAPADCIRLQGNRLLSTDSTNRDQSLRLWDIEEGYCVAVFTPDAPVACCQLSLKGDAIICGFTAESRLSTLALCKQESVADMVKRNKRRKSSKVMHYFEELVGSSGSQERKQS